MRNGRGQHAMRNRRGLYAMRNRRGLYAMRNGAAINRAPPSRTRIPLFALSLAGATLGGDATHIVIGNLATTITADGAQFLDSALHTQVFTAGMLFGTSSSTFVHA
jgi:hypothetical protein